MEHRVGRLQRLVLELLVQGAAEALAARLGRDVDLADALIFRGVRVVENLELLNAVE